MSTSKKTEATDRSKGGPGSSHQDAAQGQNQHDAQHAHGGAKPDRPTNTQFSRVSGGGGERDIHHTHEPEMKGLTGAPKRRHPNR